MIQTILGEKKKKKKKGQKRYLPRRYVDAFFKAFHSFLFRAFRVLLQAFGCKKEEPNPNHEKKGPNPQPQEGRAEKEANSHSQKAGPTFIAKGQPPFQEGPTTTHREDKANPNPEKETEYHTPWREGHRNAPRQKGQLPRKQAHPPPPDRIPFAIRTKNDSLFYFSLFHWGNLDCNCKCVFDLWSDLVW